MSAIIHFDAEMLTWLEHRAAADVTAYKLAQMPHSFHTPRTHLEYDNQLTGLSGETALKIFLGLDWRTHSEYGFGYDVHGFYEVRSTKRADGNLITHEHDRQAIFVLARIIDAKHVKLVGWIDLRDANTPDNWADWLPHPAFLTRANQLHSMDSLPRKVAA